MTSITDRERQQRIAAAWNEQPDADLAELTAAVDAELAAEAAEMAEEKAAGEEWAKGIADSIRRMMFTCSVCGGSRMPREGLCEKCSAVRWRQIAEEAAQEVVADGRTRGERMQAYRVRELRATRT